MSELNWHREMMADRHRTHALAAAVRAAVRPGDVVVDLGTGSGILALLACGAGASRVYAVEKGQIIEVARQIVRDHGLNEKITLVEGNSTRVELPEPADLIVAELIGSFGLDEHILPVLDDARQRFLKPGGRLLPDEVELFLAPTAEGAHYHSWAEELKAEFGLDFGALAELTAQASQSLWADPAQFLGPPASLLRCNLYCGSSGVLESEVAVEIARPGRLAGWIGWFAVSCAGRPILSTAPPIPGSSWENVFFPIGAPVPVRAGEVVRLSMRRDDPFWSWEFKGAGLARRFGDFYSFPPRTFKPGGTSKDKR